MKHTDDNLQNKQGGNVDEPARSSKMDLTDPVRDQERLRGDEATIDLPEVKDIPGQEHIHVPSLGELADTTASSDDEEGAGLLDDLNEDDSIRMGTEADIPAADLEMLQRSDDYLPTRDAQQLARASLDNEDFEGERLNEGGFDTSRTGSDLDTGGTDEDDAMEDIGEEDEENNEYSLGGDKD